MRASERTVERTRSLYKVKGRLTLTLKFVLFNAETDKLRYLISFTTITRNALSAGGIDRKRKCALRVPSNEPDCNPRDA